MAALLGNHVLTESDLTEFHKKLLPKLDLQKVSKPVYSLLLRPNHLSVSAPQYGERNLNIFFRISVRAIHFQLHMSESTVAGYLDGGMKPLPKGFNTKLYVWGISKSNNRHSFLCSRLFRRVLIHVWNKAVNGRLK